MVSYDWSLARQSRANTAYVYGGAMKASNDIGQSGSGNDEGTKTEISGDGNTVIVQQTDRGSQSNANRDNNQPAGAE